MVDRGYETGNLVAQKLIAPTIQERLEQQVEMFRGQLQEAEEALDALKSNPEVARIINLVSKVQHIY